MADPPTNSSSSKRTRLQTGATSQKPEAKSGSRKSARSSIKAQSTPPASLITLPQEILSHFLSLCDRPSAVVLSRVHSTLTSISDERIWRELDLSLNSHHGEYPLIRPHVRTATRPDHDWSIARAKEAEERHRVALKEKIRVIILRADARRCGMVESVKMVPRVGAVNGMLQLLDLVSGSLRRLEIEAPVKHVFDSHWKAEDNTTLDAKILDSGLSFPALKHIRIGEGAIRVGSVIPFLASLSPHLHSLHLHLDQPHHTWASNAQAHSPMPQLRDLRIFCRASGRIAPGSMHPLITLLRPAPGVERLAISSGTHYTSALTELVAANLHQRQSLVDLHWDVPLAVVIDVIDREGPGFTCLRTLSAKSQDWNTVVMPFPRLPMLEKLFFDTSPHPPVQAASTYGRLPHTYSLTKGHLADLRATPHLRILHTSRQFPCDIFVFAIFESLWGIEEAGLIHGYISSYTHGEEDLFAVRLLVQDSHIEDRPKSDKLLSLPIGFSISEYKDAGVEMEQVSYRLPQACWREASDFQGKIFHLEIVEEMRKVEGKTREEWQGRGVAVGDAAWKILTAYCDEYGEKEVGGLNTAMQP